jgi:hypothetical protein
MEATGKRPKFVRWAVMLGIVIALNLFFFAARSLVLPEPQYQNYCPTTTAPADTKDACETQDGVWVATTNDPKAAVTGYCDLYQKCQPVYEAAEKQYRLYAFVLMVGLGVLSLIVGVLPIGSSIVSTGLSYGGVLALIIAAFQYWNDAATWVQLLMSVVALGALIYIGVRRFKD